MSFTLSFGSGEWLKLSQFYRWSNCVPLEPGVVAALITAKPF